MVILRSIIPTFSDATCEKTMVTLEDTLSATHDWAVERMNTLCEAEPHHLLECVENAHAIQSEFAEWLDPDVDDHEIYSLEYLGDD